MRELRLGDAAYIAGLIDGEGTITMVRRGRENRYPQVSIANNDLALLTWVQSKCGAGIMATKPAKKATHRTGYALSFSHRVAMRLLTQVQPWLRTYKGLRARMILIGFDKVNRPNGRYSPAELKARKDFEQRVLDQGAA